MKNDIASAVVSPFVSSQGSWVEHEQKLLVELPRKLKRAYIKSREAVSSESDDDAQEIIERCRIPEFGTRKRKAEGEPLGMTQGYGSPQAHTVRKHHNFDDSEDGGLGGRLVYDGNGGLTGSPFLPGWRTDWNEEWSCFEWTMESNPQVTVWKRPHPIAPSTAAPSSLKTPALRDPSDDQLALYSQFGHATKERRNAEFTSQFASCKSNAGAIMTKSLKKLRKAEERWKTGETCGEGEEPDLTQESVASSSQFLERVRTECGKVSKRFKKLEKKRRTQAEYEETICDLILYKVLSKDDRELVSHRPKTLAEYCEALNAAFPFEQTED